MGADRGKPSTSRANVKTMGGSVFFLVLGLEAQRPKKVGGSAFAARGSGTCMPQLFAHAGRDGLRIGVGGLVHGTAAAIARPRHSAGGNAERKVGPPRRMLYLLLYVRTQYVDVDPLELGSWSWTLPPDDASTGLPQKARSLILPPPRRPGPACSSPLEPVWPYYIMIEKAESPLGWSDLVYVALKPRPSGHLLLQLSSFHRA